MVSIGLDGRSGTITDTYRILVGLPGDNGTTVTTGRFGPWSHTVEFVFYEEGTTTEIGRASITVLEGSPSPSPMGKKSLELVGNPATGPWGVEVSTTDPTECHGVGGLGWGRASYQEQMCLMVSLATTAQRSRQGAGALGRIRWSSCFTWKAP